MAEDIPAVTIEIAGKDRVPIAFILNWAANECAKAVSERLAIAREPSATAGLLKDSATLRRYAARIAPEGGDGSV